MGQKQTIVLITAIWLISFVEPSGWSIALHLPDKLNIGLLIMSSCFFLMYPSKRQKISPASVVLVIIFFIGLPVLLHNSWQGASYLVSFLTVYIISQGKITSKVIFYTGIIIASLGLAVLFIYNKGSLLSGWNDNAISMVGLFSFLYFSIFLIQTKGTSYLWIWNIVTLLYIQLLFSTNCRSGMLFAMISVAGIILSNRIREILKKPFLPILLLNIPLIISILVICISNSSFFPELDQWSINKFGKTIFNGREYLWDYAFKLLENSEYLGTGKFVLNYHNSGMATLSVFGIAGYIIWISYFMTNLRQLRQHLSDEIVFGSVFAFCLIFLQQTVDLGFISATPNLLPYMILGIGLGRVRFLREKKQYETY